MIHGVLWGVIFLWIVPIPVAVAQGRPKDRAGLAYGIFLGWVGVIILAFLPPRKGDKYVKCRFCKETIRRDALVCAHCQRDLRPRRPAGHPDRPLLPPTT